MSCENDVTWDPKTSHRWDCRSNSLPMDKSMQSIHSQWWSWLLFCSRDMIECKRKKNQKIMGHAMYMWDIHKGKKCNNFMIKIENFIQEHTLLCFMDVVKLYNYCLGVSQNRQLTKMYRSFVECMWGQIIKQTNTLNSSNYSIKKTCHSFWQYIPGGLHCIKRSRMPISRFTHSWPPNSNSLELRTPINWYEHLST